MKIFETFLGVFLWGGAGRLRQVRVGAPLGKYGSTDPSDTGKFWEIYIGPLPLVQKSFRRGRVGVNVVIPADLLARHCRELR